MELFLEQFSERLVLSLNKVGFFLIIVVNLNPE